MGISNPHTTQVLLVMLDWSAIDTVLLDMDGTLLDLQFDNYFWLEHLPRIYAEINAISEEQAAEQLHGRFDAGVGSLQWYCLDHWSKQLNLDVPALKREIQHMVSIRPFVIEFLTWLNSSEMDVVMVTNAHPTTLAIKMEEVDIRSWFQRIVVSHDLGAPKEDNLFWERLQEIHPFDPGRTLLIDDTERVLAAAHRHGIAHLLTLLQPDSSHPKREDCNFPGIHHFDEIMPLERSA